MLPFLTNRNAIEQISVEKDLVAILHQPAVDLISQLCVSARMTNEYVGHVPLIRELSDVIAINDHMMLTPRANRYLFRTEEHCQTTPHSQIIHL
jgi:hypothetical protein